MVGTNRGYGLRIVCVCFSASSCNSTPLGPVEHFSISAKEAFTKSAHYKSKKKNPNNRNTRKLHD